MKVEDLAILEELVECQGCVDNDQYDEIELAHLKDMAKEGLVELSWRITDKGKKKLAAEHL
jgi:hypothetical protein